jgi:dienelactone hydrolase/prenyltransferase beta subunit
MNTTMKRNMLLFAASLAVMCVPLQVRAQTAKESSQTAAYLRPFQNPDGGYSGTVGGKSTLGGTSSALRCLKYNGGTINDVVKCIAFVESCYDKATGGFAQTPGGKTDVGTTATGLMAVGELKLDPKDYATSVEYFSSNAKSFEDVRIAIAGLESIKTSSPEFSKWTELVNKGRNADGTWGEGATKAKDTGGKAAALLRMGVKIDGSEKAAIVAALRSAQREDGGWSQDGVKSDLNTSYRIMRCLFMLKEAPDLDRLRGWLFKHRQSDGGFAGSIGGSADIGGTYLCSIMLYWARLLEGQPGVTEVVGFQPLFNGSNLDGWEGDTKLWSAKDGAIVGTSTGLKHNDFLATKASYGDFILKLTFRVKGDATANTGIQFRSVRVPGHEMSGYQADIGQGYWGCLYDESRRNKVLVQANPKAVAAIRKDGWNTYVIRAIGNKITLTLNGVQSVSYTEPDDKIARDGKIALQIHAGNALTVEFKDIYIQPLPTLKADNESTTGFHLRTVKGPSGDRKYAVYLPRNYDPKKTYPAVLFLHGSGERGLDGVVSSLVGLGPALLTNPDDFPGIAIIVQAEKGWRADSDDAKAALAALDEVMNKHKVDANRVALTGLSMGGYGTWEFAAANPDRFSAVVPICGRGRPETAESIKHLPTWILCGDEDGFATVKNARDMAKALRALGNNATYTEYRSVGHNSWDRAYNDLVLLDWMLSQTRKPAKAKGE